MYVSDKQIYLTLFYIEHPTFKSLSKETNNFAEDILCRKKIRVLYTL